MSKKECVAMLLAGGQGSRLGVLTRQLAKPAVPFGGKYRIIDFPLSNCKNSGIDTVGVLTQYKPFILNSYIGIGSTWDLDSSIDGGVYLLPPHMREDGGKWYKGTANAIYQNIDFIEDHDPEYVLIISGDHIYKMDYSIMLDYHKEKNADATIAVIEVTLDEASRFGIMNANSNDKIYEFEEKPEHPKSNLASMGIYIFNWKVLKEYLMEDEKNLNSKNDFGKNIIPSMVEDEMNVYAFKHEGYWKDVGTIESFFDANMDLLDGKSELNLFDEKTKVYSKSLTLPPHYIAETAKVSNSFIADGCQVYGQVEHSILFPGVYVGKDTVIKDSVIMPNVKTGEKCKIKKSIVCENTYIGECSTIGVYDAYKNTNNNYPEITVIGENVIIPSNTNIISGNTINCCDEDKNIGMIS
ncbi:glucose-1-phosphate adenylyltransferase [Desulfonispora thiosulfatigenes DSM 11270]|uniref:Glucose-1-phosphate adenylyltransferase n=1 Tax=Desulfonispora thiosulfatigenes DSM 11270 TaxID=656914 RepID=A0A1W1VLQ2_DESTI|nr:glucose-1-phosphate adenylyltransferase [Desulfonispora thiosulfatigenes]SMB94287.1 glucose-1-phosphate adenylyltransferase [Desulfonispora thiosulfatigenes DSM 11270]